jgi:CBS domain-containing protein
MTLADLMREAVVTTAPDTPVSEVAQTMRDENVGSVVVVDGEEPLGLVTDRDIAVRVAADRLDPGQLDAEAVMTADPVTIDLEAGIFELSEKLPDADIRRMPVVDDGELVGIVTMDDLHVLLVGELDNLTDVIRSESPPY